jgi:hypothetical protein
MFLKRKEFSQHYKFNREFLEKFVNDLRKAHFSKITVKLPHNLIEDEQDEIGIQGFLDRNRNYPSIILLARNENTEEIIKVLFVNISRKAFFKDDTFPSGHSESPELYIQSPDPARAYSLFGFFYDYLKKESLAKIFFWWSVSIFLFIFLISEFFYLSGGQGGLLYQNFHVSIFYDIAVIIISYISFFKMFSYDGGLYIKEKEHKYLYMIKRAIKGELRDNPLINLLVVVIGGIIVGLLLKLFDIIL